MICTTQQGKSAKQTKRYLFDAELSLLIIRKFGSHEAFSESTLSYRRSQYVVSIFFESIMIREFLLYMQPKNPKIIITKLSSVYVNSYMFFQFLQLLEAARSLQLFADISAWHPGAPPGLDTSKRQLFILVTEDILKKRIFLSCA